MQVIGECEWDACCFVHNRLLMKALFLAAAGVDHSVNSSFRAFTDLGGKQAGRQ